MRTRVVVAIAAIVALLAGSVGYLVGSEVADDDAESVVAAGTPSDADQGEGEGDEPAGSGAGAGIGGPWGDGYGSQLVQPLIARTAADGTQVRAVELRWDTTGAPEVPEPAWEPPDECVSVAGLEIALLTDTYGAMGWSEVFTDLRAPVEVWGSGWTGHHTLGSVVFAVVRTTDDAVAVRLLHEGRRVDEMAPEDGWAIVAAQLPATTVPPLTPEGAPDVDAEIEVVGADGSVVLRRSAFEIDSPFELPECQPPPPGLPADVRPAGEADAAAVDAIGVAYAGVFGRPRDETVDPRPFLQDGDRLDDAFLEGLRESVGDFAIQEITVNIIETGFIDDATAVVVFELQGAPIGWQYGEAVEVDGEWKVSSQTFCSLVGMVGAVCPEGMVDPNRGPSRYAPYDAATGAAG